MRQFTFLLILLTFLSLCNSAKSDTLKLLKQNGVADSHYDITAVRPEDGKRVEEQLEHLFHAWNILSAEFLKDAKIEPARPRHRIRIYRNQEEYNANLFRIEPNIAKTNGFYHAPGKTIHLFSTETKILFHEGTHQILAERFFHEKKPAFQNNFWAVEGIALFMETLKIEDDSYKIGDVLANRLYAAKVYRFEQNHHLPIRKLTAMSATDIQTSKNLQEIYSQSATLTHWLMLAERGHYRSALFELLRQTYRDSAKPETLSELTGLSFEELDAKYAEFLKMIPDE